MKQQKLIPDFLKIKKRTAAIFTFHMLAVSLIPVFAISFFNFPCADDYAFAAETHSAAVNGGSVFDIIKAALLRVIRQYIGWQGSYSATFMMALQPGTFSESLYFLTTFIMIIPLILGIFLLTKIIFKNYFKTDSYTFVIIASLVSFLMIQLCPKPVESFFWYNGSIYYTFFFAAALFFAALLLKLYKTESSKQKIIYTLLGALLSFYIGGSNFSLILVLCELLFLFCIFCFIKKNKNKWYILTIYIPLVIGFALNILAPGNKIRAAEEAIEPNALKAILTSFKLSFNEGILNWTTLPILLAVLFLIPLLYKSVKNSKLSFKFPILTTLLTYCIYSSAYTPTCYAIGYSGPARLVNMYYFLYIISFIFIVAYWCGFFARLSENLKNKKNIYTKTHALSEKIICRVKALSMPICIIFALIFTLSLFSVNYPDYITNKNSSLDYCPAVFVSAAKSIMNGNAAEYKKECSERLEKFYDKSEKDLYLTPFKTKPSLLFYSDIVEDQGGWQNIAIARFYEKNSVFVNYN